MLPRCSFAFLAVPGAGRRCRPSIGPARSRQARGIRSVDPRTSSHAAHAAHARPGPIDADSPFSGYKYKFILRVFLWLWQV